MFLNHFHKNLADGGKLMFTIANKDDEKYKPLLFKSPQRKMIEKIQPMFPDLVNNYLITRWQYNFISQNELLELFKQSQFDDYNAWPMSNAFICFEASKPDK